MVQRNKVDVRMRHLQPNYGHPYPEAGHGLAKPLRHRAGKQPKVGIFLLRKVEDVVGFFFRDREHMALYQRIYIQKSQEIFVFLNLVGGNFAACYP